MDIALMYHAIIGNKDDCAEMDCQDRAYAVSASAFGAHLDMLEQYGWRAALPFAESSGTSAEQRVCFTFDDSWQQHAVTAAPLLKERDFPAVFFVTPGQVATPGMMDWSSIRELHSSGFAIGSHGYSHSFLSLLGIGELRAELRQARKEIEDNIGARVEWLSLPGGRGGPREYSEAIEAGFTAVFGSSPGILKYGNDILPRVVVTGSGEEAYRRMLKHPSETVSALQQRDRWKRLGKRVFGDRLYHRLHRMIISSWTRR